MLRHCGLVVLAVLTLAAPASANFITDGALFPVVAHTAGLEGTQWVTDLTIFNPMDYEVSVGVQFHPADQDNDDHTVYRLPTSLIVGPLQTMMVEDLLQELYGFEEDTKGYLFLIVSPPWLPNPAGTKIQATVRIYNTGGGEGTYGQTVPSLMPAANVGWSSSFITGARNDDAYRSNLGITNLKPPGRVYYRIFAHDSTVVAEGSKNMQQLTVSQWSFDQLGVGNVEGPLTVELWMDPGDASPDPCVLKFPNAFFEYVSKVDNITGDAEYLLAVPMDPLMCEQ